MHALILLLTSLIVLLPGAAVAALAQSTYPSWRYTGNLNVAREGHTATLLQNGKVLVVGGYGAANSAELYDPNTGSWSTTGSPNIARMYQHTATLLQSGMVLVTGGFNNCGFNSCSILNSAELYDPVSGSWSITGNLNTARRAFTATLLSNGKVLVAGGYNDVSGDLSSAELFDPATGRWTVTGNLITRRGIPTATLLQNGKVLVAGGEGEAFNSVDSRKALDSAELYDPSTQTWSSTSKLTVPREFHTATLLSNGKVLVSGGFNRGGDNIGVSNSAELYDPATGTWSRTGNLSADNMGHTATILPSGEVVVAGSSINVELYDPLIGSWSITAYLNTRRSLHTATVLGNGQILIAGGGVDEPNALSAELYEPGSSATSSLIDDAQFFVREHYVDFLDREPDAEGLAYWTNQINLCGSDVRCIHERRIGVSAAFFIELEFQETGYYVYRFYQASFGRQPNYDEFNSDRRSLGCDEEGSCFADYWVQRPTFLHAYPITMSNTEFVNKIFDTAGLTAPIYNPQRQQQIQAMNSGSGRAAILNNVIEMPDFKNIPDPNDPRYNEIKQVSQYNSAYVLMQYFGYLRRDVDSNGYDFWLDILNNREPNNYLAMVCAFVTSREYQQRFGSNITRTNADCAQ